jgi:uncharacterized protein (TIGR03089 family)
MPADSIETLFDRRLAAAPGAPLITSYDTATGERMELSAASLANWVAKTHFLLIDGLGLGRSDLALVDLPMHWMAAPVLLGCWSAGLAVTGEADHAGDAAVGFVGADGVPAAGAAGVPELYALSFATWGRGFDGPAPDGADDFVLAVRPQPDKWPGVRFGATAGDDAWTGAWGSLSRRALADHGAERAAQIGLAAGGRLLAADAGPLSEPFWLDALVAPLAVGASVVLVTGADAAQIERIAATENATAILA